MTTSTSRGTRSRNALELRGARGAGGVVRRADEDEPGPVGDGVGHRVEVVALVGGQRHRHRRGAGDLHDDRVGLEGRARRRPPRRPRRRPPARAAAARRPSPVPGRRASAGDAEAVGDRLRQAGGAHVRVAVHRRGRAVDGLEHRGQRRVGVLVGRELVACGRRRRPAGRARSAGIAARTARSRGPTSSSVLMVITLRRGSWTRPRRAAGPQSGRSTGQCRWRLI